jgi:hypothetical protein
LTRWPGKAAARIDLAGLRKSGIPDQRWFKVCSTAARQSKAAGIRESRVLASEARGSTAGVAQRLGRLGKRAKHGQKEAACAAIRLGYVARGAKASPSLRRGWAAGMQRGSLVTVSTAQKARDTGTAKGAILGVGGLTVSTRDSRRSPSPRPRRWGSAGKRPARRHGSSIGGSPARRPGQQRVKMRGFGGAHRGLERRLERRRGEAGMALVLWRARRLGQAWGRTESGSWFRGDGFAASDSSAARPPSSSPLLHRLLPSSHCLWWQAPPRRRARRRMGEWARRRHRGGFVVELYCARVPRGV